MPWDGSVSSGLARQAIFAPPTGYILGDTAYDSSNALRTILIANVRQTAGSVSNNRAGNGTPIARRAVHHCAQLQIGYRVGDIACPAAMMRLNLLGMAACAPPGGSPLSSSLGVVRRRTEPDLWCTKKGL